MERKVNCPNCPYQYATRIVFFSSVEIDCPCCNIRKQLDESVEDGPLIYPNFDDAGVIKLKNSNE